MMSQPRSLLEHPADPGAAATGDGGDLTEVIGCCAKHLAVAATDLARDPKTAPRQAARLSAAGAQFRSLASSFEGLLPSGSRPPLPSPSVPLDDETSIPLVVLLANVYVRERWWLTNGSVVPELVAGARDLLCGLKWVLPGEDHATDP